MKRSNMKYLLEHKKELEKYIDKEPFHPPEIMIFLQNEYWAIHEAVFVLTNSWPKVNFCLGSVRSYPVDPSQVKDFFYLPCSPSEFDPRNYSKSFQGLFNELETDISSGILKAKFHPLSKGISYLITPKDVILWALLKGHQLPDNLQEALKVYLQNPYKKSLSLEWKTRNKIVAQFLLDQDPSLNVTDLIDNELMYQFGGREDNTEPTAIRKAVNELFDTKGLKGRQKNHTQKRQYTPKAIPEVMFIDRLGLARYHVPCLIIAIETLTHVVLLGYSKEIHDIPEDVIVNEFLNMNIVKLYSDKAPQLILELITNCYKRFIFDLKFWTSVSNGNWFFERKINENANFLNNSTGVD